MMAFEEFLKVCKRMGLFSSALIILAFAWVSPLYAQSTTRVSVAPGGADPEGESLNPSVSRNGRFVAFDSDAGNLVPGDSNGLSDVFVYDRLTGTTTRVSRNTEGGDPDGGSFNPAISPDGRFVAFDSDANNLVAGNGSEFLDVFVYDRQTGTTTRVSVALGGGATDGHSLNASLSADGRFVAFDSDAGNLVSGDSNEIPDIFVYDRQTGSTTLVSRNTEGGDADGFSVFPSLSADGRFVAFDSDATNLVAGDGNDFTDIFVHDRLTGTTTRVSRNTEGGDPDGESFFPSLSGNGRFVAFESDAPNLVGDDQNGDTDIFMFDRQTGTTTRVSKSTGGGDTDDESFNPSISENGRRVAFESFATNLVTGGGGEDANDFEDIFVYDRLTGTTTRMSRDTQGEEPNGDSLNASLSADGRFVAFQSEGTNLIAGDENDFADVFLFDGGPEVAVDADRLDINGDGIVDVLWRDTNSGATAVWLMNAQGQREGATFPGGAGFEWVIQGVGDVNGDGSADIVWRNTNGATATWLMNAAGQRQDATFPGGAGPEWVIKGVRDLNNDGIADFLWRNTNNGGTSAWLMNAEGLRETVIFPGGAALEWVIQGVADVNADGPADIVWRNTNTGDTATWLMNGQGLLMGTTQPGGAAFEWVIRGLGDVNGDGTADFLWRNTNTGGTAVWLMNGQGLLMGTTQPGGAGFEWVIKGVGDVNADGPADILWRNTDNGATAIWVMNGQGFQLGFTFPGGAGAEWEIRP